MAMLDRDERIRLLTILLQMSQLDDRPARDRLLDDVWPNLSAQIPRSDAKQQDLQEIVYQCNDWLPPSTSTDAHPLYLVIENAYYLAEGNQYGVELQAFLIRYRPSHGKRLEPITREQIQAFNEQQLSVFYQNLDLPGTPTTRTELIQAITERWSSERVRAVVILYGLGGTGKSVALYQWLQRDDAFVISKISDRVSGFDCLITLMCDWLNLSQHDPRRRDSSARGFEEVLQLLQVANPNPARPIMYIGIDGLDEAVETGQIHIIRPIIEWFWYEDTQAQQSNRSPRAVLLVTCRAWVHFLDKWSPEDQFGNTIQLAARVEVQNFTDQELLNAAGAATPDLRKQLQASLSTTDRLELFSEPSPPISQADPVVIDALHCPAMWGAALEHNLLPRILSGESSVELAAGFVQWFCEKARRRGQQLSVESLVIVLRHIARHCHQKDQSFYSRNADWINPVHAELSPYEAIQLHQEALSSGLIMGNELDWQWAHQFLFDYLAA